MPQAGHDARRRVTPQSAGEWGAVLPQYLGMLGLAFCAIAWLITGRVAGELVTGFGTLIVTGQGATVWRASRQPPVQTPAPAAGDDSTYPQEGNR